MGDRGNIVIKQQDGQVWFYTHWSGSNIQEIAKAALSRRERWTDESYLARIVFCELVGNNKGETGFGISTRMRDNQHDILVLDVTKQKVFLVEEDALEDWRFVETKAVLKQWTFEEFVGKKAEVAP